MRDDVQFTATVRYRGSSCELTLANASVVITPQEPLGWRPVSPCFRYRTEVSTVSLAYPTIVGAQRESEMFFRIHYVVQYTSHTHHPRLRLKKTHPIDCCRAIADTMVEKVRYEVHRPLLAGGRRMHILFIINPKAGKGTAPGLFAKRIKPYVRSVLGWKCNEHITESREEFIRTERLHQYSMFAILGGDGTIHEVLQGLLNRADWREYAHIPILPFPAGSGNALATSIGVRDIDTALFAMSKGCRKMMDILSVTQMKQKTYSFLGMMHGALSSIDIGSENLRWLGDFRFTIGAIKEVIMMKKYAIKLAYLPFNEDEQTTHRQLSGADEAGPSTIPSPSGSMINPGNGESSRRVHDANTTPCMREDDIVRPEVLQWFSASTESDKNVGPDGWCLRQNFETRFTAALNIPYITKDIYFMPTANVSDGTLHLLLAPANLATRCQMIKLLVKSKTGQHLDLSGFSHTKIKALLFRPESGKAPLTIDGEVIQPEIVSIEVLPSLISVIDIPPLSSAPAEDSP